MKTCTRCHVEKPLEAFWFYERKDCYLPACRACMAKSRERYRRENYERLREKDREYRLLNKDKARAAQRRWLARNPGLTARRTAIWRAANRERALAACCGEKVEAFLSLQGAKRRGRRRPLA